MSPSPALVAIAVGVGGVAAYALYKAYVAKNQGVTGSACAAACGTDSSCLAACNAAGAVLGDLGQAVVTAAGDVNPFYSSQGDWSAQVQSDAATNATLNGAIAIPADSAISDIAGDRQGVAAITGPAYQYANGCQPFFGAPGWYACKQGTLDMYASAIDARSGKHKGITDADLLTSLATTTANVDNAPGSTSTLVSQTDVRIDKTKFLTGLGGDPTTLGPFGAVGDLALASTQDSLGQINPGSPSGGWLEQTGADAAAGANTWLVKGKRISCPLGQAPKTIALAALGLVNTDAVETCIDPNSATVACANGGAPPGFTWSTAGGFGHWVALVAGQTVDNGPCAPAGKTGVQSAGAALGLDQAFNALGGMAA